MNASERFDKIRELSDNLDSDMEEVKDNYNEVKSNLITALHGLDDISVSYPSLKQTLLDIDQAKESEYDDLIDKYIEKISEI